MGVAVIVHGFIECPGWADHQLMGSVDRHNKAVIAALPKTDDDRPSVTRRMFTVLPPKGVEPYYGTQLITFAASYKNMYRLESKWIAKFEALLRKLCWMRATVFLEFGALRYDWEVESKHLRERCFANPPQPPTEWSFNCSRLDAKSIPAAEAIDQSYEPNPPSDEAPFDPPACS